MRLGKQNLLNKMRLHLTLLLATLLYVAVGQAQQNFNQYQPLVAKGEIPKDFSLRTSSKIEEDMQRKKENLNQREQKIFLEGVHYGIDEILQSGLVIYGDEISNYVTMVAHKLLEKEPKLKKELRFYTIKSNVTNAFSTDQGIIVVTTGLISQITSEAHLAYVLAHEISHYTEKHVVEGFEYRARNKGVSKQITQLSVYSKEREFEADGLGVKLYHEAGYSKKYINSTFDVLMYSYLPIDEIPFPKDYFNSAMCIVPENKFADKAYEIKVNEDYDDSRSSHPNVRRRKTKAAEVLETYSNWGEIGFHFGEEKFRYIRNVARFERIRSDIIEMQYADALYTIYILEKEFPNSLYLHRMKAQCWYGLAIAKQGNKINNCVAANRDLEGEGAGMHVFIKNLKSAELLTIAVRVVEDCRTAFPDDPELKEVSRRTNRTLFESDRFDLSKYRKTTFRNAIEQSLLSDTLSSQASDSIDANLSKYDRIRLKKTGEISNGTIDSSDFYLYILSDLLQQESFLTQHENVKLELQDRKEKKEAFDKLSRTDRKKQLEKERIKEDQVDLSEFILVDPAVISYRKGKVAHAESEKMANSVVEGFEFVSEQLNLKMSTVGKSNLANLGTDGFNQKSFFTSMLIQISNSGKMDVFPVDYSKINEIKQNFGTSKLVFSVIEHDYKPQFSASAIYFIFFPPAILGYLPIPFIKGNNTELNLIVVDLEKAKVLTGVSYYFKEPLNKYSIEARLYDIFSQKNSKK